MRIREREAPRDNAVGYRLLEYLIVEYAVAAGMLVGGAVYAHADARAFIIKEDARKLVDIVFVYFLPDVLGAVLVGIDIFADVREHGYSALAVDAL